MSDGANGFGSKVSRWLGPPTRCRKIQLFAGLRLVGVAESEPATVVAAAVARKSRRESVTGIPKLMNESIVPNPARDANTYAARMLGASAVLIGLNALTIKT